jgi:hypothetical protein
MIRYWLGLTSVRTNEWTNDLSLKSWWSRMSIKDTNNRKTMSSITILVSWTIWKERNARDFHNKCAPPTILIEILGV